VQKSTYIHKSFSWVIVLVILHTHLCSFCCSTGILSCCGDGCADEKEHHEANACHHENEGDDCQKDHLAFFNTIGQSNVLHADVAKVFQSLIAVILPVETVQPKDVFYTAVIYTGFHPPPPKENLRILIQSFQI